jgi:hypothetical protein
VVEEVKKRKQPQDVSKPPTSAIDHKVGNNSEQENYLCCNCGKRMSFSRLRIQDKARLRKIVKGIGLAIGILMMYVGIRGMF